ncbi:MAG: hypothetical protein EZS28_023477, partial [Streblomastix strix]
TETAASVYKIDSPLQPMLADIATVLNTSRGLIIPQL